MAEGMILSHCRESQEYSCFWHGKENVDFHLPQATRQELQNQNDRFRWRRNSYLQYRTRCQESESAETRAELKVLGAGEKWNIIYSFGIEGSDAVSLEASSSLRWTWKNILDTSQLSSWMHWTDRLGSIPQIWLKIFRQVTPRCRDCISKHPWGCQQNYFKTDEYGGLLSGGKLSAW